MSLTDQDARALIHLAKRLRQDTYGAGEWHQPGIEAEVLRLVGQDLAISIERVVRHAADPAARTPGAIRRPYTPGPPEPRRELDVAPLGSRCTTCGLVEDACRSRWSPTGDKDRDEAEGRHKFTRRHERDVDVSPVVAELKGHIEHRPEPTPATREQETPEMSEEVR